ncbi:YaaA family protein [Demequina globuliformis]|uniref:YaaA family protein n=1 Tax=Demequina globuliformis TaxID=676202 RepID=UPI00137931C5|nr:peroxide stress protein YaaA [Demequina globuliformis]
MPRTLVGVLILLPPSEGKTAPTHGAPVDLESLSHPALSSARQRVGDALAKVSAQRNAFDVLGVGPSLEAEVARNRNLWDNPAAPAAQVYTGVLYDAAGAATWDAAHAARAASRVRIVSALWGALSPADRVPAYRLSMSTSLGRVGPLASYWRQHLAQELSHQAGDGIIVDCRSSAYVAAWRPSAHPVVNVRVERELHGKRTVVSHMAKHTRGLLTGALTATQTEPQTADEVADVARSLDHVIDVALTPSELTIVLQG